MNGTEWSKLDKRLSKIEVTLQYLRNNDIKHIWIVIKVILGIISATFITLLGGFISMMVK